MRMTLTPNSEITRRILGSTLTACLSASCATRVAPDHALPPTAGIHSPAFKQAASSLVVPGFVPGNKIQPLENGGQIFPAMLEAIRGARRTINFETFVFNDGEIPWQFAEALEERARAGVRVNVILDAIGASKSRVYRKPMREAGVQIEPFHPVFWLNPWKSNYRTHRKLLVIDGKVGFIGGVGISDEWGGNASSPAEWRDQHFRVEGPVVAQLQGAFCSNWSYTHREVLQGGDYFPPLAAAGSVPARAFVSAPRQKSSSVELLFELVIASAERSLLIETPYFLPDRPLLEALCGAARRGVRVRILMPGEHIDQKAVRRASRKRWPKLLAAGVELYEYEPTMIHSKLLIADGLFVSLGSSNLDPRSLRINDESNLDVLDSDFARGQTRVFEGDLRRARRVTGTSKPRSVTEAPAEVVQKPAESQL